MQILIVNTGSASIKLATYALSGGSPQHLHSARYAPAEGSPEALLNAYLSESPPPDAVCHRVVHGGAALVAPARLTPELREQIRALAALAPLHNPVALRWVEAAAELLPAAPMVAVFDTAFYAELPPRAATYALPRALAAELGLRRYGFHGIAHRAMWERWCALRPDLERGGRLISIQLGGGCSITAVHEGRPLDTSMGFSPVEGLVMATRSGDLDPGIVTYLMRRRGLSPEAVDELLNEDSGLLGLAGSGDMRTLLDSDDPACRLAVAVYCYRVRKYVGAYLAVLGGTDGIAFGGGVGEHAAPVRRAILDGMQWCGIALSDTDPPAGEEARIGHAAAAVDVRVIPVDEAAILAREAWRVLR